VLIGGTAALRRTVAVDTFATAVTSRTGGIALIMACAWSGNGDGLPENVWPAATVRRLPSAPSRASRFAFADAAMPSTATRAAIATATPSADSAERSRRARRPSAPSDNASARRSRALVMARPSHK
jgi:hypothetical protein